MTSSAPANPLNSDQADTTNPQMIESQQVPESLHPEQTPVGTGSDPKSETKSTPQVDMAAIRTKISQVLKIPNTDDWHVVHTLDSLALIHYTDEDQHKKWGWLRGVVVDYELGVKVADSQGFSPTVISSQLELSPQGRFQLTDQYNQIYRLTPQQIKIQPGIEGVLIRIFKWNNKVYRISHRRLTLEKSRWGNSLPFLNIYISLGGPTDEALFPSDVQYSPYVYFFLASHPDLQHATKQQIGTGQLYYLGNHHMWTPEQLHYKFRFTQPDGQPLLLKDQTLEEWQTSYKLQLGWHSHQPLYESEADSENNGSDPKPPPHKTVPELDLEQANDLLRTGYQDYSHLEDMDWYDELDQRLQSGEFVMLRYTLTYKNKKGKKTIVSKKHHWLRVESPAYNWRARINDDNPNLLHQFFRLSHLANKMSQPEIFRQLFPALTPYKKEILSQLLENSPITIWSNKAQAEGCFSDTVEQRLYNIWHCFILTSPPSKQKQAFEVLDKYRQQRRELIEWTIQVWAERRLLPEEDKSQIVIYNQRLAQLIEQVEDQAEKAQYDSKLNPDSLSSVELFDVLIRRYLNKEYSSSIYKMIRDSHRDYKLTEEDTWTDSNNGSDDDHSDAESEDDSEAEAETEAESEADAEPESEPEGC